MKLLWQSGDLTSKVWFLIVLLCFTRCNGQKPFGIEHLTLIKTIELPNVSGRIDHMAISQENKIVYMAALGNNTVEVIDLDKGSVRHSIKNMDEPQGVCFIPKSNELVVANGGNGKCIFYNASTYETIATIKLDNDADNVRYDALRDRVYIGYGNGAIAVIDANSHRQVSEVKLPAHPESLQPDQKNDLLFVNLPDYNSIGVIDLKNLILTTSWKTDGLRANFPMTLDTTSNSVIIGFRHPSLLVRYDAFACKEQNRTELIGDVDELVIFYYAPAREIFASGGGGELSMSLKTKIPRSKKLRIFQRDPAREPLCLSLPCKC